MPFVLRLGDYAVQGDGLRRGRSPRDVGDEILSLDDDLLVERRALVVPGSMRVKKQAEEEGLDEVFTSAGFEWRNAGCSMCLGMNPDILQPGERCASTSNRNFEGRQGKGGRTHLVSPVVAAATAVMGRFASPSELGVPLEVG